MATHLYQRIMQDLLDRLASGELEPGRRLPSENALALKYDCSRATASKALHKLVEEELIVRRRGAGSFVAPSRAQSLLSQTPPLGGGELAHPLRRRIVAELQVGEASARQLIERLGETPAQVYYHTKVLEESGVIEVSRTERRRGAIERYFTASADCFTVVAPSTRATPTNEVDVAGIIIGALEAGIEDLSRRADIDAIRQAQPLTYVSTYSRVYATESDLSELTIMVTEWIKRHRDPVEGLKVARVAIATYPLLRGDEADPGRVE